MHASHEDGHHRQRHIKAAKTINATANVSMACASYMLLSVLAVGEQQEKDSARERERKQTGKTEKDSPMEHELCKFSKIL